MTRSGRVFAPFIRGNVNANKKVVESTKPKKEVGESSGTTLEKDVDDLLKIIKMSDCKIIYQLLQTPSKILLYPKFFPPIFFKVYQESSSNGSRLLKGLHSQTIF